MFELIYFESADIHFGNFQRVFSANLNKIYSQMEEDSSLTFKDNLFIFSKSSFEIIRREKKTHLKLPPMSMKNHSIFHQ